MAQLSFIEQQQTLDNISTQVNQLALNSQSETAHWQSLAAQSAEKKSVLATVSTWLEEHAAEASLLTDFPELGQLKKLRAELIELSGKHKTFTRQSKKTISTLKNNTAPLPKKIKNRLN